MHFRYLIAAFFAILIALGCAGGGIGGSGFAHIYIADGSNGRIIRIDNMTGANWVAFGSVGSGVDKFDDPTDIAIDSIGRIYIVDYFNNRIVRIDDMAGTGWTTF